MIQLLVLTHGNLEVGQPLQSELLEVTSEGHLEAGGGGWGQLTK